MSNNAGPIRSRQQKIGSDAVAALYANKPDAWEITPWDPNDFGLDFAVTLFNPEALKEDARYILYVQLKGTTQESSRIAAGEFISHSFERSTLHLWHRSSTAVLVVVADLIGAESPKEARLYYRFVSEELDDLLQKSEGQSTVTIRIPTANVVHSRLNVLPEIDAYNVKIGLALRTLEKMRASGLSVTEISWKTNPRALSASDVDQSDSSAEFERLVDSSPDRKALKSALTWIREGDYARASRAAIEAIGAASDNPGSNSKGLWHFIEFKAYQADHNIEAARQSLSLAANTLSDCDDVIAAEAQYALEALPFEQASEAQLREFLSTLDPHTGMAVATIKAKVLGLLKEFDAARAELNRIERSKALISYIIVSVLEHDWARVLSEAEEGLSSASSTPRQRLIYLIFRARSKFEQSVANTPDHWRVSGVLPATGLPGISYSVLRDALSDAQGALDAGQRLSWPFEVEQVIDIAIIASYLLGESEGVFRLLELLVRAKPKWAAIRVPILKLAIQTGHPDLVLDILSLVRGELTRQELDLLITANCLIGSYAEAIDLADEAYLSDPTTEDTYLAALPLLGVAASRMMRPDLVSQVEQRLERDSNSQQFRTMLESILDEEQNGAARDVIMGDLMRTWHEQGQPTALGFHLLDNLHPNAPTEAPWILDISAAIEPIQTLNEGHTAVVAQAELTLEMYERANARLEAAADRFEHSPILRTLRAIASEAVGDAPRALTILEDLLAKPSAPEQARRLYIELLARLGKSETAEVQLRSLIARSSDRQARLELLNMLFRLHLQSQPASMEKLKAVALEFGRICDQSSEREEGLYIQQMILAGFLNDAAAPADLEARLMAFRQRFPDSKGLIAVDLTSHKDEATALAEAMKRAGLTEDVIARSKAAAARINAGTLSVPFSWRPRRFLVDIQDVPELWNLRVASDRPIGIFLFQTLGLRDSLVSGFEEHLLVSLTTLLLLDEIGLLSQLLAAVTVLTIARSTIAALQTSLSRVTGGDRGSASSVLVTLSKHAKKIRHPARVSASMSTLMLPEWFIEENQHMRSRPEAIYLSEDAGETIYVCDGESVEDRSATTSDVIVWLSVLEIVDVDQAASFFEALIAAKVMTGPIPTPYLLASLPALALQASNPDDVRSIALADRRARAVFEVTWNPDVDYVRLSKSGAEAIAELMQMTAVTEHAIIGLWMLWAASVRFHKQWTVPLSRKLALSFLGVLLVTDFADGQVRRLWALLMSTLNLLGEAKTRPVDQLAIAEVATVLGEITRRHQIERQGEMFNRAWAGLTEGTALHESFHQQYIEAVAQAVLDDRK